MTSARDTKAPDQEPSVPPRRLQSLGAWLCKKGTRTWAPDRLKPSAPDGRAGRPCPLKASGCPGWHGVGRAGTACPGPGDLPVPGWPHVHQGDGHGATGGGAPVTFVSVCALFVVSKFSDVNTQLSSLLAAQEYSPAGRETSFGTNQSRPPSLRPQPGPWYGSGEVREENWGCRRPALLPRPSRQLAA